MVYKYIKFFVSRVTQFPNDTYVFWRENRKITLYLILESQKCKCHVTKYQAKNVRIDTKKSSFDCLPNAA